MIENYWGGHGQKWVCQSGDRTLKLTVSEGWTDGINWFFGWWYRFIKIKVWSKIFWVGIVKNGCSQSVHGTPKLTVSQKWADVINWVFACWYKQIQESQKLIQWFLGWAWSKMAKAF